MSLAEDTLMDSLNNLFTPESVTQIVNSISVGLPKDHHLVLEYQPSIIGRVLDKYGRCVLTYPGEVLAMMIACPARAPALHGFVFETKRTAATEGEKQGRECGKRDSINSFQEFLGIGRLIDAVEAIESRIQDRSR